MFNFKYDYLNNILAIHQGSVIWYEIPPKQQFTGNFGSLGFKLGSNLNAGWIAFNVVGNKIRVFYKYRQAPRKIIRYQKVLPKEVPVVFTFNETDQIEKINGKWVKRGGSHE